LRAVPNCLTNKDSVLSGEDASVLTMPGSKSEQLHSCTSEPSAFITYNCGYSPPRSLKNTILPFNDSSVTTEVFAVVAWGAGVGDSRTGKLMDVAGTAVGEVLTETSGSGVGITM